MTYDSITNRGDYLSPHYLAEILPKAIREKGGLRSRWAERGSAAPDRALRALRGEYESARESLARLTELDGPARDKTVAELNGAALLSLGYAAEPRDLEIVRSGETYRVPVAYAGRNVVAVDCGWATDADAAFDAEAGGRLLAPVSLGPDGSKGRETIQTGAKLARWLFAADDPPRYVLLLHGGLIVLADRLTWGEGRYLAASLNVALERVDPGELETIAALFSADALQPPAEGGEEQLAKFVAGSRTHAVGVSSELREGLRESVQIIANEVLDRLREQGAKPEEWVDPKILGRKSLRYLYRILFLLYAEARPELGVLPVQDQDYMAGYSMARLGELVARRLGGEEARRGLHLYESLQVLFRKVNEGHRPRGSAAPADDSSEGEGLRFEPLKADLFLSSENPLIGRHVCHPATDDQVFDTRLRDEALYKVLRRLMLTKGRGRGAGRRGKTERGGFISYAQLGINQLGAVYEGLMSYTGFIAAEELYEVAKNGDPAGGSWMIPAGKVPDYPDDVFVMAKDENGFKTGERVRYKPGSFVYRLAGRDRQTSASYYTPQSLTSVTVQLALEQREKEEDGPVTAADVLRWRVCEPALGSGAFLNEAIDQLGALYLRKRESELGEKLEPDERALALQRVKAYIALHNCYGVDLNETAVELAEVSIWLNVMHRGLQAPWFGLHLVRGNSLIGAGRRLYPVSALSKAAWLDSAPVDHPFSAGGLADGHVHHFLLPAKGWGAVAGEKEAKQLAPEDAKRLADWRKQIRKAPSAKKQGRPLSQVERLQALSKRAEYLWFLVRERLRISEREISRPIEVWGAEDLPAPREGMDRDRILEDLQAPGTPYWRLKTLMDAWCALWFWPVDKADLLDGSHEWYKDERQAPAEPAPRAPDPDFPQVWEMDSLFGETTKQLKTGSPVPKKPSKPAVDRRKSIPLANLDNWLDFAEALLGRRDVDDGSFAQPYGDNLAELSEHEDGLEYPDQMYMDSFARVQARFPWLDEVCNIAEAQGFFHWELRFAGVFAKGGFDLQVGNPPWVRSRWDENIVLAELEPWFELAEKIPVSEHASRKAELLMPARARDFFLGEVADQGAKAAFFSSTATYDLLAGTQPDLYRAFMVRTWRNSGRYSAVGLLHPDTHFTGDAEKRLRAAAYSRLRAHGDFTNPGNRFFPPPVDRHTHFGIHVYGYSREIGFSHLAWLLSAEELPRSIALAENAEVPSDWDHESGLPGIRYKGGWDVRPHPARVIWVNRELLTTWQYLSGTEDQPVEHTKLLNPLNVEEQDAINSLGGFQQRLSDLHPRISRGYDEANAKKEGLIRWEICAPNDWSEAILKGSQIAVATPFFKQPPHTSTKGRPPDLTVLPVDALPRSEYERATSLDAYYAAQDLWIDSRDGIPRPYTDFYRLAWRRMIADNTDRSLFPAILPPGPAHVHSLHTLALSENRDTALVAGFWAGLPMDYFLRITGTADLQTTSALRLPAPSSDHPFAGTLLLRTLRLNCLTTAYADLWAELYEESWREERWVVDWPGIAPLGEVGPAWKRPTPLRTEYERRAALVEIDALVAVWLGITEEQLEAIYPARYPVLGDYEEVTWFDATGRKIAGNWNTYGTGQTKQHWEQFQSYLEAPSTAPPPEGYSPLFYKADRVAEYRQAHAAFTERLNRA